MAALTASYHAAPKLAMVWLWRRTQSGGPVGLFANGAALIPPGSKTQPAGALDDSLAGINAWTPIACGFEGLIADQRRDISADDERPSIESVLLEMWHEPFALLILAEPVEQHDAEAAIHAAADNVRSAQARADSSAEHALVHERAKAWHRELRQADSTGLWKISIAAGGADQATAAAVAGLAVASFDLGDLAYTLTLGQPDAQKESLVGTRLLAAITRPPSAEVYGVRLALQPEFDLMPESDGQRTGAAITIGTIVDRQHRPAGKLALPLSSLNRHTFVCGATGAGKSQTVRGLLEEATKQGIPWLVVEPAKAEYRAMSARLRHTADVIVIRPGDPQQIPAGIDPLRPAEGFPLQTHLDLVRALFLAAFDADEPFPQVLAAALTRAYEEQGWDIALGTPRKAGAHPRYPTLTDLQVAAERVVEEIGYGREVADNVRGFVRVRLSSLRLGTTGRFLEAGHPIDFGQLLRNNVVLEIEGVGDDRDKSFIMGTVLIALTEHLRVAEKQDKLRRDELRHLTVFEEAHRLLRRTEGRGAAAHAVEMFAALLAEIRAYGEGLVVAEQIPAKLLPDVIKNTAVKVVHRLPAKDDREAVGATMNLTEPQSNYLVTLPPGTAAVFSDGMDQPVLVRMPDGTPAETGRSLRTLDPSRITQSSSGRCAAQYGLHGRPLSSFIRARSALQDHPLITLWVELQTVAHLFGRPGFEYPDKLGEEFESEYGTTLRAVIADAVDEAVAVRSGVLAIGAGPALFAEHLSDRLVDVVCKLDTPCRADEKGWRAAHDSVDGTLKLFYGLPQPSAIERALTDRFLLDALAPPEWVLTYLSTG